MRIATRASRSAGHAASVEIQAEFLRHWRPSRPLGAALGFATMPEHGAVPSGEEQAQGKARWRQSDVKRAISAAGQAGLQNYRIEIGPDSTIAIVVLPSQAADEPEAHESMPHP